MEKLEGPQLTGQVKPRKTLWGSWPSRLFQFPVGSQGVLGGRVAILSGPRVASQAEQPVLLLCGESQLKPAEAGLQGPAYLSAILSVSPHAYSVLMCL